MDDNLMRKLKRMEAKWLCDFDQQLQEAKLCYDQMSASERQQLRTWLSQLAKLQQQKPGWLPMIIRVHTDHTIADPEGEVVYEGHASLSPNVMLKAIEAWDKGEGFSPEGIFGTL